MQVRSLGQEDSLEEETATHSSILAWKIPWTEGPSGLQSMGSRKVGHDWMTSLSLFTFMHWRRKWQPLQCSCLENPRDWGAWWAAVYGVAQSRTRLKRLSSSSSSSLRLLQIKLLWTCVNKIFYSQTFISLGSIFGSGMTGVYYVKYIFDFV